MRILLVEDDHNQEEAIREAIQEKRIPGVEVEVIRTELGFRNQLDTIVQNPPNLIILDGMIRWTDPSPEMIEPPSTVRDGGPFLAGRRCLELIGDKLLKVPVIFYTILELEDLDGLPLPSNTRYLPKREDPGQLTTMIQEILGKVPT